MGGGDSICLDEMIGSFIFVSKHLHVFETDKEAVANIIVVVMMFITWFDFKDFNHSMNGGVIILCLY